MFVACAKENDQDGIFSFKALYEAYLNCRKGKRNTINALQFEADLLGNLTALQGELITASYQPGRSVCFYTTKPKLREIMAANFRDRVVHHLLIPRMEAIFEAKFIYDSFGCRLHKGTHAAVRRLRRFVQQVETQAHDPGWYLQLDIRSYFMNIRHDVLLRQLAANIHEPRSMALAEKIIRHNPASNCHIKDKSAMARKIPPHKSLFHTPPGQGLPIGNLSSQFFANVYLNELDQFVKHDLKCRCYIRYVDDFVLLHPSPDYLLELRAAIQSFLHSRLKLQLKELAPPQRVSNGIDFLGYITRGNYVLVRNRVVASLRCQIREFESELLTRGKLGDNAYWHLQLQPQRVFALQQVLASYLGHYQHADSFRLTERLFYRFSFLADIFILNKAQRKVSSRLLPLEPPPNLAMQYQWFAKRYPKALVLMQVGRYCEIYNHSAIRVSERLGLKQTEGVRGFAQQVGFPLRQLAKIKHRLKQKRIAYIVVAEQGQLSSHLKKRAISEIFRIAPRNQLIIQ